MISNHLENPIISFSVKAYQVLLVAYPSKFQQEYGSHMLQVFQDCCLRAYRQNGTNGMLKLWAVTLFDLIHSLIEEHLQKETDMKKNDFIRLGGWSLMVGAIVFLPGAISMLLADSQSIDWNSTPMQLIAIAVFSAPILLALGMLGLRARYRNAGGILLFGAAVGGILVLVGMLVQFLTPDYSVSETYYYVWLGGVFLLNACLSIFGILALMQKPMPRWNWLPLVAGAWIPLLSLLAVTIGPSFEAFLSIIIAGLIVMTIAQVMLGYILQADASQDLATA
jgi:hypothetical protein